MSKYLYEQSVDQSNYRAIFENQKEKLIEVLEGDLMYPYNGGYFTLGAPLFFEVKMYIDDGKTTAILLDINYNPITIKDLSEFLLEARSKHTEALNKYKMGLARLKKSRMIPTLVKLHDMEDDIEE